MRAGQGRMRKWTSVHDRVMTPACEQTAPALRVALPWPLCASARLGLPARPRCAMHYHLTTTARQRGGLAIANRLSGAFLGSAATTATRDRTSSRSTARRPVAIFVARRRAACAFAGALRCRGLQFHNPKSLGAMPSGHAFCRRSAGLNDFAPHQQTIVQWPVFAVRRGDLAVMPGPNALLCRRNCSIRYWYVA